MDPQAPNPQTTDQTDAPQAPDMPDQFQEFQVDLETTIGNFVIAASNTVNELVDQAKYWLGSTDSGMKLQDGQVASVTLQQLDPATGEYVNGEQLPVESKKDIITQVRTLGAR